jgi:hypothetical protein
MNREKSRHSGMIRVICITLFSFLMIAMASPVFTQAILFDFDNAPLYTSLPINQTANGITVHLAATGQGYSIQAANVLGFTPPGFAGHILYPNSISISNLLIRFSQTINDFSIMYSCQELGCDDAATMRVTAYMNGLYVGTSTRVATYPGTWPVDTLRCKFPQGFDSVVVHYDSPPPTCGDYGTIYLADNMRVTPFGYSKYWTGSVSDDWNTPDNWSPAVVPSATDHIIIPSSVLNMPIVYNNGLNCHTIFVLDGATVTINPGISLTINGTVIFEGP